MREMGTDPKDTQPFANGDTRNNREYVPATWAPAGGGSGHPKTGGGYEQSKTDGTVATRGFNRKDQRYSFSESELQSRREARALAEFGSCVVLQGSLSLIELRSGSGNNYDLGSDGSGCDCPDKWRLRESGKLSVQCKHELITLLAISDAGGYSLLPWSASKLAEVIGVDERTAQQLCATGKVPAVKVHGVWVISYGTPVQDAIDLYQASMIMPDHMPEPTP